MAEETGQATVATTSEGSESSTAPATTAAPKLLGEDGRFAEKWHEALPEDLRGEKSLQTFKDVAGLAKSYVNAQRMLGKNKVAIPGPTSGEGEWSEFWKAAGRPETAADYNLKRPADVPEEYYDEDVAKAAQDLFHKIGLSGKQAEALFAFNNGQVVKGLASMQESEEADKREAEDALKKDWGAAYQQKIHLGNIAIEQGVAGNDEFKDKVVEKFGNDPDFIRFAANLGGKFSEHGVKGTAIPTPSDLQTKISEMMQSDAYMNRSNPGHKAAVAAVHRLFQQKADSQKG